MSNKQQQPAVSKDASADQQTPVAKNEDNSNQNQPSTTAEGTGTTTELNLGNKNASPVTPQELGEEKVPTQSQDVSDWSSLINAVEDSNIGIINLDGDITVDGSSNLSSISTNGLFLNKEGIARDLTINGNHHTLNFGNYFVKLGNKPQNGGLKWNVIFKDLNVEAGGPRDGQYAPLYMGQIALGAGRNAAVSADNQKNITVTFDGVTANLTGGRYGLISGHQDRNLSVFIDDEYYHLVLQGDNTVTSEGFTGYGMPTPGDTGDALSAGYITVKNGTTTVTQHQTSSYNLQYGGAAIRVAQPDKADQYSIDVKQGATLNINGGKDVKGIVVAKATTGTVNIDGSVNMDMGDGHSIAMLAGNLNVGKDGKLIINTKQVQTGGKSIANFNSGQYGVLSIGVGYPANTTNQNSNTINDNGVIQIVRTVTNETLSPMISMGSGSSGIEKGTFTINVNPGATLDLQDSTKQTNLGMIFVSGSSVNAHVNFNAPKYVNLQRLSALPSNGSDLIYLEGGGQSGRSNGVTITQSPIAQWDEGNVSAGPSYVWIVNSVNSMNNWGDNAGSGFTQVGKTSPQNKNGEEKFFHSNGTVTMAPTQAGKDQYAYDGSQLASGSTTQGVVKPGTPADVSDYYTPYLNQFLNHFSYWTPQRLAMGSKLLDNPDVTKDADKYQPVVKTINGRTDQTLADLNAKSGIDGLIQQTGVDADGNPTYAETHDLSSIQNVSWYNSATDATDWNNLMGGESEPNNPTGNLQTSDKSAWAKVTYTDGSIDFVNIPLNITEPSIADQQTPDGGTITVPERHTLTSDDAKNAITNNAQLDHVSGYTWKTAPDTTVPGTKDGVVTVTYTDNSTDDVPVVINVQSQADQYTPQGQDITTPQGTRPDAKNGISNTGDLPSGTTYTWSKAPDVSKPGTVPGVVEVTYPDGSKDEVPIQVTVGTPSESTTKTDAEKNNPQGQNVKTTIGKVPVASEGIANKDTLPAGTTYTWSQEPNVYTKGDHPAVVEVTYPDGSVDYVPTTVTVTNEPTGKNVTTPKGVVPDAQTTIDWGNGTEPSGTTITWVTEPDVSQPGNTTGTVQITYPDHETTTVVVPVHVTDPSTENNFDPYGTTIRVPYGHELTDTDAQNAIAGGIPSGTTDVTYTWKYKPATSGANVVNTTQQGYVTVKGTLNGQPVSKDVIVYVRVGDQADNYDPQGQNLVVRKGTSVPDAKTAIANASDLPSDAQYEWALGPDTNTAGTQSCLVKVTYPDHSFDYVPVNVTVCQVSYDGLTVERPNDNSTNTNDEEPTISAGVSNGGYQKDTTFTDPTGTTVTVGNDGKVTVEVTKDAKLGTFRVPVKVSYQDGTTAIVYVPVSITGDEVDPGGDHTYYGNQSQTIMKAVPTDVHKTSDDFTPDATKSGFNEIIYNYDWDGTSGNGNYLSHTTYKLGNDGNFHKVNTDGTLSNDPNDMFAASKINYTWMTDYTPNTNFGNSTDTVLAKNPDGSFNTAEQTGAGDNLPGNSKYRVNVTISDTSVTAMLGLGFRPYSSWNNVYFNFYGAKSGDALTFKQNSDISNLTQDQYRQLIDVTDLGAGGWNGTNINPNAPQVLVYVPGTDATKTFTMTWAPNGMPSTATVANGVRGTVRILFNDGTYLDVPATINVVKDNDADKPDKDKTEFSQKIIYTYNGKEVAYTSIDKIAKGDSLTAAQLRAKIDANVPNNYQIASDYIYPDAVNNITATPKTIEVKLSLKDHATFAAEGHIIYQTADGTQVGTGSDIKTNKGDTLTAGLLHDLADQNVPKGYKIVTYPGTITVSEDNFTIPVTVEKKADIPVPYDPTKDNMDMSVTRKINYDVTGTGHAAIPSQTQTVQYTREDSKGNAGYQDPVSGEITWNAWHVKNNGDAKFPEANVKQIHGYDSYVEGTKATKVSEADVVVTNGTPQNGAAVTVTYQRTTPATTDADKYAPSYKDTTVNAKDPVDTGAPSFTSDGQPATAPAGTKFAFSNGQTSMTITDKKGQNPVTATIDANTGAITFTAPDTATEYDVPVTVTYPDASTDPATAKVFINKTVDPTTVDPTNPAYKDMFKTVTRDIITTAPDGHVTTDTQSLDFGRTMTIHGDGSANTYGNWEAGKINGTQFTAGGSNEFAAKDISQVTNYTSYYQIDDGRVVAGTEVPSASALDENGTPVNGLTVHVTYKSNSETPVGDTKVTYQFHDDTDNQNVGNPVVLTGKPGTAQDVDLIVPDGYKLAAGQTLPTSVTMPNADETILIHLVHATKTVNPGDPGVNPTDPLYQGMFKTVTRTINVQNPDGTTDRTLQQVHFNRSETIDAVTNKVLSYGDWSLADGSARDWGEFNVPQLNGYTSYVDGNAATQVNEESVTPETADVTVEVTYQTSGDHNNGGHGQTPTQVTITTTITVVTMATTTVMVTTTVVLLTMALTVLAT